MPACPDFVGACRFTHRVLWWAGRDAAGFRQKTDQPLAELVRRSCFPNEGGAPNR